MRVIIISSPEQSPVKRPTKFGKKKLAAVVGSIGGLVGIIAILANLATIWTTASDLYTSILAPAASATPHSNPMVNTSADPASSTSPTLSPPTTPAPTSVPTVKPTAQIGAPPEGLTTTKTRVTVPVTVSPASVSGYVWYVAVRPHHHTKSDYLYRLPAGATSIAVDIGPARGDGSGPTDKYDIVPVLIDADNAAKFGGYDDKDAIPQGSQIFAGVTIQRKPQP